MMPANVHLAMLVEYRVSLLIARDELGKTRNARAFSCRDLELEHLRRANWAVRRAARIRLRMNGRVAGVGRGLARHVWGEVCL